MKISTLETQAGIPIAIGAETKKGLQGIFYLNNLPDYFSLIESLDFPLEYVYSLNGNRVGLACEIFILEETRRFLSPDNYFSQDEEFSGLIQEAFKRKSAPRISINFDFKSGSYEIKPYS